MKNAIFFDRDGTLIHDRGFITNPEKVVFYSRTFDALKMLQEKFELFIISNQSGIAKGMQSFEETEEVNKHIIRELAAQGIIIRGLYSCPHKREDNCRCMKPKPYFAQKAAVDYGISLSGSFSIGDHPHDVELARNFGGRGVYVLTGHGKKHRCEIRKNDFVAKNIFAAATLILKQPSFENAER
ncbi:MAG: HAD-IIIA family hydrolase [Verrucomicrobia bacterium]|nr:HAD-IIIA family hydrolase [Verrucomicrobiota bacterium]MBU4292207.1 HAD-IIIA family hydrolase [Verrucomicrobiota bacterium]MBU4496406.1 HAD-IIIA family hydrolase [Verrucomicrobiota bacterium]MCG2678721.1 HAD-IIIA family hydrolase [Kiritimatiellia bacterium]